MERVVNFIAKYWYYAVIFTMYGATIFYIGGICNDGWRQVAGVDTQFSWAAMAVLMTRLIVMVFICTKAAFLTFELMYPYKDCYVKEDVWFFIANFVLLFYVTELAIIDILLHGI